MKIELNRAAIIAAIAHKTRGLTRNRIMHVMDSNQRGELVQADLMEIDISGERPRAVALWSFTARRPDRYNDCLQFSDVELRVSRTLDAGTDLECY